MNIDEEPFIKNLLWTFFEDAEVQLWLLTIDDGKFHILTQEGLKPAPYTMEELLPCFHDNDRKRFIEAYTGALKGIKSRIHESFRVCYPNDKTYNTYSIHFITHTDAEGCPDYMICSLKNISCATHSHDEQVKLLSKYEAIFQNLPYPIAYFNEEGDVIASNNQAVVVSKEMYGCDIFGVNIIRFPGYSDYQRECFRKHKSFSHEIKFNLRPDKADEHIAQGYAHNQMIAKIIYIPIMDGDTDTFVANMIVVQDMTQERIALQTNERYLRNLQMINEEFGLMRMEYFPQTHTYNLYGESFVDDRQLRPISLDDESVHPEDRAERQKAIRLADDLYRGVITMHTRVFSKRHNEYRYIIFKLLPNFDHETGNVNSYFGMVKDDTRSKKQLFEMKKLIEHNHLINERCGITLWIYVPDSQQLNSEDPFIEDDRKSQTVNKLINDVHPDFRSKLINLVAKADKRTLPLTTLSIRAHFMKDNDYCNYDLIITPLKDEHGQVIQYGLTLIDQTEFIKLRRDSENSQNLLATILKTAPVMIYIKDIEDNFRYVMANDYLAHFFHTDSNQIVGRTEIEFASTDINRICHESDVKALTYTLNKPYKLIEELTLPDGSKSYLQCIKFVHELDGRKLLMCAASDVTELLKAKEKAEESDRLKSAFLANISHEIRTPLNAIVGFSNLLMMTDKSEEKEQYGELIRKNNDLLLVLINDILDLSKLDSGNVVFEKQTFVLNDLLREIYEMYIPKFASGIVRLEYRPAPLQLTLHQDERRLHEVICNFINNAIKYTEKGTVSLWFEMKDKGVKICVSDTGIGISEGNQQKIFNRFEKLNSMKPGTGLGLSICKTIAQAMNGEVGVSSQPGKGSTFWIWLPTD